METELVPAHIHFTKWFIRIRWIAFAVLLAACIVVRYILDISIRERSIFIIAAVLLVLNVIHKVILNRIKKDDSGKTVHKIKLEIHFQIITDLILLTFILHFSGGVENPIFIFYFFHLIIASSIFSNVTSYLYVFFVLALAASLSLLEMYGLVPHYSLSGFVDHELFKSPMYVYGSGFVFACTAVLMVFLSHMIISRSIKSEETYARTNLELQNKDKLKNEYVLRVTHDIKGHVAAIMSCIEVVRNKLAGPLNPSQEEFVNRAYQRAEVLSEFVKNLLNLTRKRLQHDIETEEFSLKDLINKVVAEVRILAAEKSIDFNVYIDRSVNIFKGNPYTIEELYSNLLLNAVKYTPPNGHIELSVKNRMNYILTEISDSGIGIPADELPKVFDEFYRASNVPKDIKSGSGLGLSIARQIVESHNGKIWINSEVGIWTKVSFTLVKST